MAFIYNFVGRFIATFYYNHESIGLAIIIVAVLLRLIMSPVMTNHIKTIKFSEALKPRVDEINKKYKHDRKLANSKVMDLLNNVRYPYFGSISNFIWQFLIAILITVTVKNYEIYVMPNVNDLYFSGTFLFLQNVNVSAYEILKSGNFGNGNVLYIAFPAISVVLKYCIDGYMRKRTLVERELTENILLIICAFCCVYFTQTFAIAWVVLELFNIGHLIYVQKFVNVNIVENSKKKGK